MSITKKDIDKLKEIIQNLYLSDDIPWVIGYSGGKDSTAALQLIWFAIEEMPKEQRKKTIHVISTDTLAESPVVAKWVERSLDFMHKASEKSGLPFVPHRLTPDLYDTFWVNLLGRGYPYPRQNFRWCTDRMKIRPANTFVQNVVAAHGEVILVLGTRKAESINRARTMEYYEKRRVREYLSSNSTMQNELVFSPLENWSDDDVWVFLMQYRNPWGYSNKDLMTMYRGATADGECPLVINTDTPSCGKSRFGCWVCTLVEQDKSMAAMIMNDSEKEWMTPMLEFRNYIGDAELDRGRRDFRRKTGRIHAYKGRLVHGPYKKNIREEWLHRLLEIQTEINQNGPEEFQDLELITIEELQIIRTLWLEEKHEFDDSLPGIYERATGKEFPYDGQLKSNIYGKPEWDLLSEVCNDLYPDEELLLEMMSGIIDIERKSSDMKKRKGILKNIENKLKTCFYKNEEDALEYALKNHQRKKDMGGKHDGNAEADEPEDILEDDIEISSAGGEK